MPLASSTDLILAGINDIVHALNHPSPGSPLAPLTDSQVAALRQLTTVLTNLVAPTGTDPSPPAPTSAPAALLRVPTSLPTQDTPPLNRPASLRVPIRPSPAAPRTVRFAPLPVPHNSTTLSTSTGPTGRRRRKSKRRNQQSIVPPKTLHPLKLRRLRHSTKKQAKPTPTVPPKRPAPNHRHGTRANTAASPLNHIAATVKTLFTEHEQHSSSVYHTAFHGNAFNPDTGKLAEFLELSQCSQGDLWQQSNADKIGRLAQGHGNIKGTNTIFFIDPKQIPQ
jgi:hypothetical protein